MRVRIHIVWLVCWCLGRGAFLAPAAEKLNPPGPTTNIVLPVPPPPPLPKSPVPYFRELLAMSPAQLDQALAAMAEPRRKILQAKLREYAALTAEEREDRLRATELRWYLRPLMEMAPANRTTQIASIPDEYRMLVAERLKQWDALPRETQKEFLDNEWAVRIFWRIQSGRPSAREDLWREFSPQLREKLDRQLAAWLSLPPERRQRMCDNFRRFFELSPAEKRKTLGALSDAERQEMEKSLQAFAKLPPSQIRICVNSFRKFANMTPEERGRFLKSAERWKEMTPGERQTWRALVTKLPPLPPGFGGPPLPPLPKPKSGSPPFPTAPGNLTNAGQ